MTGLCTVVAIHFSNIFLVTNQIYSVGTVKRVWVLESLSLKTATYSQTTTLSVTLTPR